jgi:uncharacterized membrane protein YphA (DoxX/SURF4 family)
MIGDKAFTNDTNNESALFSWFFLVLNLASAFLISKIDGYSFWFLALLLVNMLLSIVFARKINKAVLNISRLLLGLLFIYSGFVKGVDPLGTQFKIEDYFFAYGMAWAAPIALVLSVLMNALEFSMGALFFLKVKTKWVSLISIFVMLFFTLTTLYDALYSPVPDCGCFGDALIITNWQTFYKNLVINSFVLIVFLRRFDFKEYSSKFLEYVTLAVVVFGFIIFENYNINNLPVVDFRPWKVGNYLIPKNPKPVKYFLTYKNDKTGEEKEYLSKELPWQDSTFMADWKWLSSREEDPNVDDMNVFPMIDNEGVDVSKELVSDSNYVFIFSIYHIGDVPKDIVGYMNQFFNDANSQGFNTVVLNSDLPEDFSAFKNETSLADFPVFNSDDTALKAAVRSNPGLIVVRKGRVIAKYHYRNFTSLKEILSTLDD